MSRFIAGHEFEAIKLRYEDQVALLRQLAQFDFKIFASFFAVQLAMGNWLSSRPIPYTISRIGLTAIDVALGMLSIKLLYNQHCRRQEVAKTIQNINAALGFDEPGVYLENTTLNPLYARRYWFKWYVAGVTLSILGLLLIIWTPLGNIAVGEHLGSSNTAASSISDAATGGGKDSSSQFRVSSGNTRPKAGERPAPTCPH